LDTPSYIHAPSGIRTQRPHHANCPKNIRILDGAAVGTGVFSYILPVRYFIIEKHERDHKH